MTVETFGYVSQLNPSYPAAGDPKSEGDDHIRGIKSTLQTQFPNLGATAVTPTAAQLNDITNKSLRAGDTYAGTHDFTGATINVPTAAATDNDTSAASTAMVQAAILASSGITAVLPGQGGNSGKFLTTNGTTATWGSPNIVRSARTANTILAAADQSTLIDITSGTFTQTFTAAATLGSGWYCYIRNSGTGDITLDPNGSETIDGLTSYVMYPGEVRLVQCDGTGFNTIVLVTFNRTFTATGTFTTPPGYSYLAGLAWSGGESGARNSGGGVTLRGGAGGGCFPFQIPSSSFGSSLTITIGAGGAARATDGTCNAGGNTTVGSLLTVYGAGVAGVNYGGSITLEVPGSNLPGSGFEAAYPFSGSTAGCGAIYGGATSTNVSAAASGKSIYGGGAGASYDSGNTLRAAGASTFGGSGGTAATAGSTPAGGGGASNSASSSGAGARGEVRIWGIV